MVRQSVFDDVRNTLDANGWPVDLQDAYPNLTQGEAAEVGVAFFGDGEAFPIEEAGLGGQFEREYEFFVAFNAPDERSGVAFMAMLHDRYAGLTAEPTIPLHDYTENVPAGVMDVSELSWTRLNDEVLHLFQLRLLIVDYFSLD